MRNTFFTSTFGNIYYELSGSEDKPLIIFIHGVGMNHHTFQLQIEAMKNDYRLLVWDLPGHGRSSLKENEERFTKLSADCLYDLMTEIGADKAVLVGQSLGSLIVQHFMANHPSKVAATVHVPGIELRKHIGSWAKVFVPFMMGMFYLIPRNMFYGAFGRHRAENTEVQNYLSESISQTGKELALRITKDMVYDLIEEAPPLPAKPMLITYGEKDLFFIRKGSENWHKKATDSICVKIPGANHIANQDNPVAFNQALTDFLDSI